MVSLDEARGLCFSACVLLCMFAVKIPQACFDRIPRPFGVASRPEAVAERPRLVVKGGALPGHIVDPAIP